MRILLLVISLYICDIAKSATYYVSPTGNDSNPGTITQPFKNWEKLSSIMVAGDIAYIRGGTYTSSHASSSGYHCLLQNLSGTASNPIKIWAYPGEYPILDLTSVGIPTALNPVAFYINNCQYLHIKGLRVTGLQQNHTGSGVSRGMELWSSPNCTIEQVEIDHIGGFAFHLYNGSNDILVKNCDVHHIDDRYSVPDAWGAGDGFGCTGGDNSTRTTYDGCRAWWCSDDGWDNFGTNAIVTYKNCWSFWNGYEPGTFTPRGNGEGFKLGPTQTDQTGTTLRFLNNCLSFHNADNGFDQNGTPTTKYQLENCTAYDNASWGFQFQYWPVSAGTIQHVFRNNAALGNGSGTLLNGGSNTYNDHNTWNGGVTISSTDFLSVSSTGVDGARQADGSLPSLSFLKLASSSDLIDKGVNVGLPFSGTAPDLGAFEYAAASTNTPPTANANIDQVITLPVNSVSLAGSGTDPDGTISAYLWTKISGPTGGAITNTNSATTSVTGLTQGVYQFQLKVTDNSGATDTDTMQVTVNAAVNQAPSANAGLDQNITLPTNSVSLNGSGTDPDGTISAYLWTKISGPTGGAITNTNSATTSVTGLTQGVYQFQLKVTDNSGATDTDTMQVTVNAAVNQAPSANAGLDQNITLPTNSVSLNGSGTDPDGTISAYLWTKISGPTGGAITNTNSATTSVTGLTQGVYQFQLKVTDNSGATDTDTMQVTVNAAVNQAPSANAGLDQNITLPTNSVSLNGSGTDPDGTISAYLWTKISGPTGGAITNTNSATTSVTGLTQGVYQFQLKVTDNSGATDTDTMQVTVNAAVNQAPSANAGLDQNITLPTNSVSLNGSGTDPDGTISAYLWTKISGPTGGAITNTNSATTSVTGLTQGVYQFQLKVTDNSGATDTDTMQVTVNAAVNQAPSANAGLDQNITLPTNSVSLNGSGTDPDGTISAYLWTKISGPTGGAITNTNSATTSVTGLTQGVYQFQLKVTDNSGATDTDTMQVTVNAAVNQAPSANAGLDQNITLPTNSVSLNGSGTDPDGTISAYLWTKISGPTGGAITNTNSATTSVTGLTQGVYQFQLKVTDNSGATDTDTMQVTVNAAVNQAPSANAGLDQNITLPTNSVSLNGSGTDPDGTISAYLWTKISGPTGGAITNTNSATTSVTGLTQGVYQFQLKVTDNSGATDTDTMQVTVNAAVNQAPSANAGLDQNITLPTNSVSLNGSGTDPDGTISAYLWTKISGPTGGAITNTNSATTSVTGLTQGVYQFQLKVTDNSGATDTDTMQVTVNAAVNQAPSANAGLDQNITLPTNSVSLNGSGTDPDGTISAYLWTKISGPTGGAITNTNSATTSVTGLTQGVYQFQLKVTDNSGATDTDTMQVTVNAAPAPINEAPTAFAGPDSSIYLPDNSITLSGSGIDPDGQIVSYDWRIISGPAFLLTNSNSAISNLTDLQQGIYEAELTVTDNSGATGKDTIKITVGAERLQRVNDDVRIIGNPVQNTLTAEISSASVNRLIKIVLFNINGVLLYEKDMTLSQNVQLEKIDMTRFSKGAYILKVYYDRKTPVIRKAIKM